MKKKERKELLDVFLLFGVALAELLLLMYIAYNGASVGIVCLMIAILVAYFVQAWFRYVRYWHLRHIFTEDELKKQNRPTAQG